MADITAAMVSALRERTGGVGILECKKALVEANGDMELAEEIIAKAGNRKAAKSATRVAAEGVIVSAVEDNHEAVLVEINTETDFVARDANFKIFAENVAKIALDTGASTPEELLAAPYGTTTVEEERKALITRIGENIQIRRLSNTHIHGGFLGVYVHTSKIGVMVHLDGGSAQLAKDMAMQIAAMPFEFLTPDQVPAARVAKEKEIFMEQSKDSGKPAEIVEKMIQGRLTKYLSEICLVGQPFIKDQDLTVEKVLSNNKASIHSYVRFVVGEGIEKQVTDFAAEVAQQVRGR